MNKKAVLYHIFGLFLCPVFFVSMFTIIFSVATLNYEYLPAWLDGMSVFFYNLSAYAVDLAMFFAVGGFAFALSEKKVLPAVLCGVTAAFHAFVLPIIQFFVRSVFFVSIATADIMKEYLFQDFITAQAASAKAAIALIVCALTFVFFKVTKRESRFVRPYIAPFSVPSVAALIVGGALALFALVNFTFGGEYSGADFLALVVELAITAVNYIFIILGARAEKYFSENKTILGK